MQQENQRRRLVSHLIFFGIVSIRRRGGIETKNLEYKNNSRVENESEPLAL